MNHLEQAGLFSCLEVESNYNHFQKEMMLRTVVECRIDLTSLRSITSYSKLILVHLAFLTGSIPSFMSHLLSSFRIHVTLII